MTELELELYEALKWVVPLAEIALEDCRQARLRAGHSDIGAGTARVGLWPFEVGSMEKARALRARVFRMVLEERE